MPGDVEDPSKTAQVESIQLSLLPGAKSPGLAAQGTSSTDLDLCMLRQFVVGTHSLCQSGHGGSFLANALV